MPDDAAKLARFLVEERRAYKDKDLLKIISDRFPNISEDEFARGFSIAEETIVSDINTLIARKGPAKEIQALFARYNKFRGRGL